MSKLSEALVDAAVKLNERHAEILAVTYSRLGGYSWEAASKAEQSVPAPHRPLVAKVNSEWKLHPELPGLALSTSLEAARGSLAGASQMKATLVVTGPDSIAMPVQLTSEVVVDLIKRAKTRILIVSFAAYKIDDVVNELKKAVDRGVSVDLILESAENLDGGGGAAAYSSFNIYNWPKSERNPDTAKLHAKAVVADGKRALLTSANLTNAAFENNLEIGILCEGGNFAAEIQGHFQGLIQRKVLRRSES